MLYLEYAETCEESNKAISSPFRQSGNKLELIEWMGARMTMTPTNRLSQVLSE
jgi:hypothetical protein